MVDEWFDLGGKMSFGLLQRYEPYHNILLENLNISITTQRVILISGSMVSNGRVSNNDNQANEPIHQNPRQAYEKCPSYSGL